jgi:threonine dehydratase
VTELAAALALASSERYILDNQLVGSGNNIVTVASGDNMNSGTLIACALAPRAALGEGHEALLRS